MLDVQPHGGQPHTVKLQRQPADDSPLRGPNLREQSLPRIKELKPGTYYVDLDRVDDKEFSREVFPKLKDAKGVVFDVRGYPLVGTYILQWFTEKPLTSDRFADVITRFPDRRQVVFDERPWTLKPSPAHFRAKIAFLTDGRAVSYAETFLSLVANHKLA